MGNLLDEYKKDYVNEQKKKINKNFKVKIFIEKSKIFIWKNKWKILLFIFVSVTLLFPNEMGTIIGKWINSFFSGIINEII